MARVRVDDGSVDLRDGLRGGAVYDTGLCEEERCCEEAFFRVCNAARMRGWLSASAVTMELSGEASTKARAPARIMVEAF